MLCVWLEMERFLLAAHFSNFFSLPSAFAFSVLLPRSGYVRGLIAASLTHPSTLSSPPPSLPKYIITQAHSSAHSFSHAIPLHCVIKGETTNKDDVDTRKCCLRLISSQRLRRMNIPQICALQGNLISLSLSLSPLYVVGLIFVNFY